MISDEGHKIKSNLRFKLLFVGWLLFIATIFWQGDSIWDDMVGLFKPDPPVKPILLTQPTQAALASVPVGVLLPNDEKMAVRENANRQLLGFRYAFKEHDVLEFVDWGPLDQTKLTYEELQTLRTLADMPANDQLLATNIKEFFETKLSPLDEGADESVRRARQTIISEPKTLVPILKNMRKLDQHVHRFAYPIKRPPGGYPCDKSVAEEYSDYCDIFDTLERWYVAGKRTFIVTMSGAALEIKKDFPTWAGAKPDDDQPVLVATVASAPNIANLDEGVFRHYIRSQDESDVFTTFVESLPPLDGSDSRPVFVFYVDDPYGDAAKTNIKKRLGGVGIRTKDSSIPLKPALSNERIGNDCDKGPIKECIELKIDQSVFRNSAPNGGRKNKDAIVIIVGYGTMIERLLNALRGEFWEYPQHPKFEGQILVVSTFTEEAWRPKWLDSDKMGAQLNTVAPKLPKNNELAYTRGVVFQWSYLTLDRALTLRNIEGCENVRQPGEFWHCWANSGKHMGVEDKDEWADVEFTEGGDSRVKLRLLKCNQWNTALNPDSC